MKPLLTVKNFRHGGGSFPDFSLDSGNVQIWPTNDLPEALAILDYLTGLESFEDGEVFWFGCQLSKFSEKEHLATLARTLSILPDGGLLENLTIEENILLPAQQRYPRRATAMQQQLLESVSNPEGCFGHTVETLPLLPYQLDKLHRFSAAFLQAMIACPEVCIVCSPFQQVEAIWHGQLKQWLGSLRTRLAETAWLFLVPEQDLRAGFPGDLQNSKNSHEIPGTN